ncbi:F0F1 ATP synthase subunit gamma [Oceanirhabdus sp. W0125-5]|uniref:F0F1 ATP synthase subunit gamma n=1 Tax=Oceanirhabdus sp. W0125-5 TaxID=2999116 RepID=UPI0022F2F346|nr:FoF1 ATP synthase subunit gamma [Oceanirhabdus sp. W0125-5]WBW98493.1 F0F1 ATP synthase subunit gamma [Oceanirhabdus sp. W0125-5]
MGASLALIKRRIKSIENTMKITKAMSMVANSKFSKSKSNLYVNNEYTEKLQNGINKLLSKEDLKEYAKGIDKRKKLFLILSSDVGLCGAFNTGTAKKALIEKEKNQNCKFIVCGMKGRDFIRAIDGETIAEYVELPYYPSIKESRIISNKIMRYFKEEKCEIFAIYYKFISAIKKELILEKIFPFEIEEQQWSGNEEISVEDILTLYFDSVVLNILMQSKTSELSFRIETTNSAIKNGKELLVDLKKMYNRIRQSNITNEISEIIGGVEALK